MSAHSSNPFGTNRSTLEWNRIKLSSGGCSENTVWMPTNAASGINVLPNPYWVRESRVVFPGLADASANPGLRCTTPSGVESIHRQRRRPNWRQGRAKIARG